MANVKATDLIDFTRASTGTYLDSDGTLKTAANNIPRIEYDSDGNLLGLLIEEARTNLLTYSEDFDVTWSQGNVTVVANAVNAPNGSLTADKVEETTADNVHRVVQSVSTSGQNTVSVFAKPAERSILFIRCGFIGAWFDLTSGTTLTVQSGLTASIQSVGNGWYRCDVTTTQTSYTLSIGPASANNTVVYEGVLNNGIYIWGAQVEAGAFPTSYIKTTGSTATRSADVASIDVDQFGYNQSEGTLFVEFAVDNTTSNKRLFSLNDGGTAERIDGLINSANSAVLFAVDGNSNVVNSSIAGYVDGEYSKVAASYDLNNYRLTIDGATPVSDTSATVPTITTLTIGTGPAFAPLNGHIKSLTYTPKRLSNAKLQELTS